VTASALFLLILTRACASLILVRIYRDRVNELLRITDVNVLKDLNNEYKGISPGRLPQRHDAMASWIVRVHEVLTRREWHRATLEGLRHAGIRGRRPISGGTDVLQQLVSDLGTLLGPKGRLVEVQGCST